MQIKALFEKLGAIDAVFEKHFSFALKQIFSNRFISLPIAYSAPTPNFEKYQGPSSGDAAPVLSEYDSLPCSPWNQYSPERFLISTLCRYGVVSLGLHVETLLPIFAEMANPRSDPAIRISCLALLQVLFDSDPKVVVFEKWQHWIETLFRTVFFPSLSWRSGKVAASMRLQALLGVNALCAKNLLTADLLCKHSLFPSLLQTLCSSLDDSDPSVRLQAVRALEYILRVTPEKLDGIFFLAFSINADIEVVNLYREMIKRLDDSHDEVRIEICFAFKAYLNVIDAEKFDRTSYKYLVHGFLVHLDDPSVKIKDAVFALLTEWRLIDAFIFYPEVKAVRDKHTNPTYCDKLLAMAK